MKKLFLISVIGLLVMSEGYIVGAASAGFNDGAGPADLSDSHVGKRVKVQEYPLHQAIIDQKGIDHISYLIDDLSLDDCNAYFDSNNQFDHLTPAMIAAEFNRLDVLKKLYTKGVNLNLVATNFFGEEDTVLSLALKFSNFDIADWLLDLKDKQDKFVVNRYVSLSSKIEEDDDSEEDDDVQELVALPVFFIITSYLNQTDSFLSTAANSEARVVYVCDPIYRGFNQECLKDDSVDKVYSLLCKYFKDDPQAHTKMSCNGKTVLEFAQQDLKYRKKVMDLLKHFCR